MLTPNDHQTNRPPRQPRLGLRQHQRFCQQMRLRQHKRLLKSLPVMEISSLCGQGGDRDHLSISIRPAGVTSTVPEPSMVI